MSERRWQHALITGASSGIGAAYARQLAPQCAHLTLVARRADRLAALAAELGDGCTVELLSADLLTLDGVAQIVEHTRQREPVDLLVNNAGFSTLGAFAESDVDAELEMIRLHQDAALVLLRAVLPAMRAAGRGTVINVSSISAFLPLPGVATYAASKAFLTSFSQSLQREVADQGVQVQCLCPGYTRTEIHSRDSFAGFDVDRVPDELWMEADEVVSESLAALPGGAVIVIPGERNRALVARALESLGNSLA